MPVKSISILTALIAIIMVIMSGCVSENKTLTPSDQVKSSNSSLVDSKANTAAIPAYTESNIKQTKYSTKNPERIINNSNDSFGSPDEPNETDTQTSTSGTSSQIITSESTVSAYSSSSQSNNGIVLSGSNIDGYRIDNTNNFLVSIKGSFDDNKGTHLINEALSGKSGKDLGKATSVMLHVYINNELVGELSTANVVTTN